MKYLRWIAMILLFCGSTVFASEPVIVLNAEDQFQFAQTLSEQGEHLTAATEFIRFIHLFPGHPSELEARYRAGLAFYYAGRIQDAERHLKKAAYEYSLAEQVSVNATFALSDLYVKSDRPGEAVMALRNLIMLTEDMPTRDIACFRLGWLMLDHGEQIQDDMDYPVYPIKEAQKYFSMVSDEGKETYRVDPILERLEGINDIRQKNPVTAGMLSVIPGGGFLYCGRYKDALVSFLFNTTLILAAYHAFDNDNPYLGGAIAFVESGFYTGNIYGAVTSAHKYNHNKKRKYIESMKQEQAISFPKLSLRAGKAGMEMAVVFTHQF